MLSADSPADDPPSRPFDVLTSHIDAAYQRLRGRVIHTPLVALSGLNGTELLGKAENLQRSGSFKYRGALNRLLIAQEKGVTTVLTASTGNHGYAVALVCRQLGIRCRVYLPTCAKRRERVRLEGLSAQTVSVPGDPLRAEVQARDDASLLPETLYISPYNDIDVIAGQGTIGCELIEVIKPPPNALFVATGGGGLVAGVAAAVRNTWPKTRIFACFPQASPVLAHAMRKGFVEQLDIGDTISTGTAGNIESDSITLGLCQRLVTDIVVVEEMDLRRAVVRCLVLDHLLVEGSTGVALAAATQDHDEVKRAVVVLCGGNLPVTTLVDLLRADQSSQ